MEFYAPRMLRVLDKRTVTTKNGNAMHLITVADPKLFYNATFALHADLRVEDYLVGSDYFVKIKFRDNFSNIILQNKPFEDCGIVYLEHPAPQPGK